MGTPRGRHFLRGISMLCFRYVTPAIHGRGCFTREEALRAALQAGQAVEDPTGSGEIVPLEFVRFETQPAETCASECACSEVQAQPVTETRRFAQMAESCTA